MSPLCIAECNECTTPNKVYFYVSTVWLNKQRGHKYPKTSTTHWNKLGIVFVAIFYKKNNRQNKDHLMYFTAYYLLSLDLLYSLTEGYIYTCKVKVHKLKIIK